MPITIGQAVYGERNNGHALLAASPLASGARDIIYQMDIQGTVPPGVNWKPFLTGFMHQGCYVLARTAPDPDASRPGMVRSRALFIPIEDAAALSRLAPFLNILGTPASEDLADLTVQPMAGTAAGNIGLSNTLLEEGEGPVVWPSQDGFEATLEGLWGNLWPEARLSLSFRLAFTPQDLADQAPTIVAVPAALVPRWTSYRIVNYNAERLSGSAAAFLAGGSKGDGLRERIAATGAQLRHIMDLRKIAQVDQALMGSGDTADLLDGLRILCHLSPSPDDGSGQKDYLISLIAGRLGGASAAEIRMARNLDLAAIAKPEPMWQAIEQWASSRLALEDDVAGAARAIRDALIETGPVPEWQSAIRRGLQLRLNGLGRENAKSLWRLFTAAPELLAPIMRLRPGARNVETALSDGVPAKPDPATAEQWLQVAAELEAPELHAACCAALFSPREALKRHLAEVPYCDASLERIVNRASAPELVKLALAHEVDYLLEQAATAASAKPVLLAAIDIEKPRARALWARSVKLDAKAWQGPREPAIALAKLLDAIIDQDRREDALLLTLADTPLANLLDYPRRSQFWPLLPAVAVDRYLSATANAWEARLLASPREEPVEALLAAELAKHERTTPLLERLAGKPGPAILYFRSLPGINEGELQSWLADSIRTGASFATGDAEAIGSIVAARSWSAAARAIADRVLAGREDLRPALKYIISLIDWVRQYELDMWLNVPPADAKWRTLEELAIELYGFGPRQDGVWERAGGRTGDIPIADTGAESWRRVFAEAKQGKRVIEVPRLIATMSQDYPLNSALRKMRYDSTFDRR